MLGSGCSDLTGSFRLYKKSVIEDIMRSIISKGYAFQMEIIIRAEQKKLQIEEVPIVFVDRIFGESKLGANEVIIYLQGVWKLFNTF
jgi:dolichol-phosphate mannosyltransferase